MDIKCEMFKYQIPTIYKNIAGDSVILLGISEKLLRLARELGDDVNVSWLERSVKNYSLTSENIIRNVNWYLSTNDDYLCMSVFNELGRLYKDVKNDYNKYITLKPGWYDSYTYRKYISDILKWFDIVGKDIEYLGEIINLNSECVRYNC